MQVKSSRSASELHRRQLLDGFATAVEARGYATTTIAEIVAQARVSKRTFYEHFTDKEDCFMGAFGMAAELVMAAIARAIEAPAESWEDRLRLAAEAYVGALEERPALTRLFLTEIHAAGKRAQRMRREVLEGFAEQMRGFVEFARAEHPELRSLSAAMATAIVGGIHELLLVKVERGGGPLGEVAETALELVRSVVTPRAPSLPRKH